MESTRRRLLASTTLVCGAAVTRLSGAEADRNSENRPLIVSTWPFGKPSNDEAMRTLGRTGSVLDAVERGIAVAEADEKNRSVGLSGHPNAAGVVQQDACIMLGAGHRAGSVAAIEGIVHPISVARRVMEKTPHVMLVGEGARMFAVDEGFESVETDSDRRHDEWRKKQSLERGSASEPGDDSHDTIALLVLGPDGEIAGGCSTSGWGGKLPGRVGDSPIIGSGLYVDNEIGAAGATGLGENVMRYCGSFLVVELMRQGLHPEDACLETIRRIARQDPRAAEDLAINFVALDKRGRHGAAGTGQGFNYAVTTRSSSEVLQSPGVTAEQTGPEGGNVR